MKYKVGDAFLFLFLGRALEITEEYCEKTNTYGFTYCDLGVGKVYFNEKVISREFIKINETAKLLFS